MVRRWFRLCPLAPVVLLLAIVAHTDCSDDEWIGDGIREVKTSLHHKLIHHYGPRSNRPVKNESTPVKVRMRMLVDHVVEFDEPMQQVTLFCSMKMVWRDEYLTWNVSEYGGLTELDIDVDEIWQPSATLLTSNSDNHLTMLKRLAHVTSDGVVTWLSPIIMTSMCMLNVELFPFDEQLCTVEFGPWSTDRTKEDMDFFFDENEKSAQRYRRNGVWAIVNDTAERKLRNYTGFDEPIAEIHYYFWFQRQSKTYVLSIVIPSALLSMSTMLIFLLPPESGEKISFGITNLLAMVLFQETVRSAMPPTGSPIFANYICVTVVVACMSLILEAIFLRMYNFGDSRPVPDWLYRRCCAALAKSSDHLDTYPSSTNNGSRSPISADRKVNNTSQSAEDGLMGRDGARRERNDSISGRLRVDSKGKDYNDHRISLSTHQHWGVCSENGEKWKAVAAWFEKNVAIMLLIIVIGNIVATSFVILIKKMSKST